MIQPRVFLIPLGGCCVDGDGEIRSGVETGALDGLYDDCQCIFVLLQIRCVPALIAHTGDGNALLFQNGFQRMEYLRAALQRFFPAACRNRHDHKFLNVHVVGSVGTAIENVHHGNRKHFCIDTAQVAVQAETQGRSRRFGIRYGNTQDGVGTETAFVWCAVQFNQDAVDVCLIQRILSDQRLVDLRVDVMYRF